MKIDATKGFLKAYARLSARQRLQVDSALVAFQANRTDPSLRDHPLKGHKNRLRALSAGWDLRVVYREEGGFVIVVLIDVGTHNQVY